MNLRAALLRQLTDLKKDGLLGPNIVLRKTMLDECKGDKFEELLAAFSLIVLNKIVHSEKKPFDPNKVKRENVVPLILSFRKGIQRDIEERKESEHRTKEQLRSINSSIEALSEEAKQLQRKKLPETPENADLLKTLLRENWIGDYAWVDTLLRGVAPGPGVADMILAEDMETDNPSKLLTDLESKVEMHNARLARWQTYLKHLQEDHQAHPAITTKREPPQKSIEAKLTRHLTLKPENGTNGDGAKSGVLISQHKSLLESLNREMNYSTPSQSGFVKVEPVVEPAEDLVTDQNRTPRAAKFDGSRGRGNNIWSEKSSESIEARETKLGPGNDLTTPSRANENRNIRPSTPPQQSLSSGALKATRTKSVEQSLTDRTRTSLALFETPKASTQRTLNPGSVTQDRQEQTVGPTMTKAQSDRTSLLERTRQSMSMLTNVLDDSLPNRRRSGPKKPTHTRSKTVNLPSQRPRLERAWSEESLASAATKDDNIDLDADYESVFMSRPRLAMSPNLSPQRVGNDLWLESQLEEGMNNLKIDSSPEESRVL